ncbi:adhesin [Gracilaria domingensis]|nr:adhesin [Gracilaria domingensis]
MKPETSIMEIDQPHQVPEESQDLLTHEDESDSDSRQNRRVTGLENEAQLLPHPENDSMSEAGEVSDTENDENESQSDSSEFLSDTDDDGEESLSDSSESEPSDTEYDDEESQSDSSEPEVSFSGVKRKREEEEGPRKRPRLDPSRHSTEECFLTSSLPFLSEPSMNFAPLGDDSSGEDCQSSGSEHLEEESQSDSHESEVRYAGTKRKRVDDQRPGKRRRLDPYRHSTEAWHRPSSLSFLPVLSKSFIPTVESISRGVAELTISSAPRMPIRFIPTVESICSAIAELTISSPSSKPGVEFLVCF